MECGVPFCHSGCPLGNLIPDWNDLVYRDRWQDALRQLHATNNFPEFTGRLCPAPCEAACVLEIREGDAVTIKQIENAIIDRGFEEGWIAPSPPTIETGRTVAVVGAGPAGMAAAQQLRRAGHRVILYERDEAAGGLIRFGVPDFKIEKSVVERRVDQLVAEGVELRLGVDVGRDVSTERASRGPRRRGPCDRLARTPRPAGPRAASSTGSTSRWTTSTSATAGSPRTRTTSRQPALAPPARPAISAAGKHVIVIGGGDTGADCVGNSLREGAASIVQLELLPEPPAHRPDAKTPWPTWPNKMRLSYAMKEAEGAGVGERAYSVVTTHFSGADGRVAAPSPRRGRGGARRSTRSPGPSARLPADLVLLAMGFVHPEHDGLVDELGARPRPARQRQGRHVRDLGRGRLRRRRRPPRPVVDRLGDQRGSPVRPRRRPLPARPGDQRPRVRPARPQAHRDRAGRNLRPLTC